MFKKIIIFITFPLFFILSGCNSDIKDAVREKLKDPDSAKFEEIITLKNRACVRYNAKNSYGAYTGISTAHLVKIGENNWYVEYDDESDCSKYTLEKKITLDKKEKESEKEILSILKNQKMIDEKINSIYQLQNHRCYEFVSELHAAAGLFEQTGEESYKAEHDAGISTLKSGSCNKQPLTSSENMTTDALPPSADATGLVVDAQTPNP